MARMKGLGTKRKGKMQGTPPKKSVVEESSSVAVESPLEENKPPALSEKEKREITERLNMIYKKQKKGNRKQGTPQKRTIPTGDEETKRLKIEYGNSNETTPPPLPSKISNSTDFSSSVSVAPSLEALVTPSTNKRLLFLDPPTTCDEEEHSPMDSLPPPPPPPPKPISTNLVPPPPPPKPTPPPKVSPGQNHSPPSPPEQVQLATVYSRRAELTMDVISKAISNIVKMIPQERPNKQIEKQFSFLSSHDAKLLDAVLATLRNLEGGMLFIEASDSVCKSHFGKEKCPYLNKKVRDWTHEFALTGRLPSQVIKRVS